MNDGLPAPVASAIDAANRGDTDAFLGCFTPDGVVDGILRVPPDPEALAEIARASGGQAFEASDADQLTAVYERLGSQLGTREETREITAAFAD